MTIDTQQLKGKLESELTRLQEELKTIGYENPNVPGDWIATEKGEDASRSDENERADMLDAYQENKGFVDQLEVQYNEVKNALERIEAGTYGKCEVCQKEIEGDRLEAVPSARTCKEHMNEHLANEL